MGDKNVINSDKNVSGSNRSGIRRGRCDLGSRDSENDISEVAPRASGFQHFRGVHVPRSALDHDLRWKSRLGRRSGKTLALIPVHFHGPF